jgi:hypothetical protein
MRSAAPHRVLLLPVLPVCAADGSTEQRHRWNIDVARAAAMFQRCRWRRGEAGE